MGKIAVVILILAITLCTAGCEELPVENNLSGVRTVEHTTAGFADEVSSQERVEKIKEKLGKMTGVISSAVVVEGHTAIVGLTLATGSADAESHLRADAQRAVQVADEATAYVSITTNPRIVSLIAGMEERRRG